MRDKMLFSFLFFISLIIVAFGQSVWVGVLGYLASIFGFALFFKSLFFFEKKTYRFYLSTCWFFLIQLVQLSWMTSTDYVGLGILLVYFFMSFSLGLQFGFLSQLFPIKKENLQWVQILSICSFWTLMEWSRLFFLSGFSWDPIGLALTNNHYSMQLASVFGVFGLSFWVLFTNLLTFKVFFTKNGRKAIYFSWGLIALFPYCFGFIHEYAQKINMVNQNSMSVLLIQTSLSPEQKEPSLTQAEQFVPPVEQWSRVLSFIKNYKGKKIDLIVLPEAAIPFGSHEGFYSMTSFLYTWQTTFGRSSFGFLPPLEEPLAKKISLNENLVWRLTNSYWAQAIANYMKAEVVIGLDYRDKQAKKNYNSGFHFIPFAAAHARYEKQVLVPMVEYFPFKWCGTIAANWGINDVFTPGTEAKVFQGIVPFSISICYEETYGHLMRYFRKNGAQLLVNISNDGWFPSSKLPIQHFELGKLRSVENGVPILRACNTGLTAGVDCFGRTIKVIGGKDFEKKAGALYVELPLNNYPTLYSIWGDNLIIYLSLSLLAVLALLKFYLFIKNR